MPKNPTTSKPRTRKSAPARDLKPSDWTLLRKLIGNTDDLLLDVARLTMYLREEDLLEIWLLLRNLSHHLNDAAVFLARQDVGGAILDPLLVQRWRDMKEKGEPMSFVDRHDAQAAADRLGVRCDAWTL